MDLVLGGDLQFHLRKQQFTEEQTKFVIACLIQALDAVHTAGIIHKDIKPANLVFDAKGYLKLVDFGIARLRTQPPAKQEFGTHGYMAPEVMSKRPYGTVSDYFAVGVIAYECMLGKKPYSGSKQEIQTNMMQSEIRLSKEEVPSEWSAQAVDFINQCLLHDPAKRMSGDMVKQHEWFVGFNWSELASGEMLAPFLPSVVRTNFDEAQVNKEFKDADAVKRSAASLKKEKV